MGFGMLPEGRVWILFFCGVAHGVSESPSPGGYRDTHMVPAERRYPGVDESVASLHLSHPGDFNTHMANDGDT